MPDLEKKKNWFNKITPELLNKFGPSKRQVKDPGSDIYAGGPVPQRDSRSTVDILDIAEKQIGRK